jgi:SAM-dependent methyltransferase
MEHSFALYPMSAAHIIARMDDQARREHELAHWAAWQDKADTVWGWQTPAGKVRADRRANLFVELGRMTSQSVVLEIGCGTGEFSWRVAPRVGRLHATDFSPELLHRCEARLRRECPEASVVFERQDAMAMTCAAGSFNAMFGCSMLHHVNVALALREVCRVLKPGGWCVFSEPNMLNPQIALQKNVGFIKRRVGDSPDETAFFKWEMERLLREAGFVDIAVRNFDFLHPFTPPSLLGAVSALGEFLEKVPLVRAISGSLILCARKP